MGSDRERGLVDPMFVATLRQVVATLDGLGIRYLIGGSVASSVHGDTRFTFDTDIVADMRLEHVSALVAALGEEFYADAAMMEDAIQRESCFNIIHYECGCKVDVFVCGDDSFRRHELDRAVPGEYHGVPALFASPEDTILAKLRWYRDGGEVASRQLDDVAGVVTAQGGRLDVGYMRRVAEELGVRELLEAAFAHG
jgi:hypothetical protein